MNETERKAIQQQILKLKASENVAKLVMDKAKTVGEISTAYQLWYGIKTVRENLDALINGVSR